MLLSNVEILFPLHFRPVTFHHVCRWFESALPLAGQRRLRNYVLVNQQVQRWPKTWGGCFQYEVVEHQRDTPFNSLLDTVLSHLLPDTRPVHDELGRGCEGSDRTRPTQTKPNELPSAKYREAPGYCTTATKKEKPRRRSECPPGGECVYHIVHIPSPSRIPRS